MCMELTFHGARMSLIIMEPSLHTDNGMTGDVAKYKVALVTFHCNVKERGEGDTHKYIELYNYTCKSTLLL